MKRNSRMFLFIVILLLTGGCCFLMTGCQKDYDGQLEIIRNQLKAGENSYTELKEQITSLEKGLPLLKSKSRICRTETMAAVAMPIVKQS